MQASQVIGILTSNAGTTATLNTVRNLTTNIGTGTAATASVIGMSSTNATPSHNFSQNIIFNLRNTNTTAASTVTGIQFTGGTANNVQRNLIYDLFVDSNSATAEVTGIRVAGGTTLIQITLLELVMVLLMLFKLMVLMNLVGLIISSITVFILMVHQQLGTANSFAFNSAVTANTRSFRNNIFFNASEIIVEQLEKITL